ncbi:alpha/beta hydrolase [Alteromonas sp. LMIT006]|jgi:pimeloyl-ACP methyl ester carboxylesterase|uniref:alpha/beta fold hydrolase n=1 Tax=Alteromonadaceae TaxID=72275 RepID=UPI0020CA5C7B|nr:alpha/beta hydrolase [Alteromonas sp. LMIT006]UTP72183.1 alpha/beta hydrolase [Alteromonas sp. LMIT006]
MNISFVHANGIPAPTYQTLFDQLPHKVLAKHQYAHDEVYPLVNGWVHQVDELLAYLDAQHLNAPVLAMGHSFGAVISYMAVARAPERFCGLVMCDPPLLTHWSGRLFEICKRTPLINKITPAHVTMQRKRQWQVNEDVVQYFAKKRFFAEFVPQCINDYVSSVTTQTGDVIELSYKPEIEAEVFRTIPTDLAQYFGQVNLPSLLITGKSTDVTVPFLRKKFLAKQPNFSHCEVQGGHMFPLEVPNTTAQVINEYIASL